MRAPGLRMPATIARHDKVPGRGHLHDHHHMCSSGNHVGQHSTCRTGLATVVSSTLPALVTHVSSSARRVSQPPSIECALGPTSDSKSGRKLAQMHTLLGVSGITRRMQAAGGRYSSVSSSSSSFPGFKLSIRCLLLASYSSRVTTSSMRRLMPATSSPVIAPRRSVTRSFTSSKIAGA